MQTKMTSRVKLQKTLNSLKRQIYELGRQKYDLLNKTGSDCIFPKYVYVYNIFANVLIDLMKKIIIDLKKQRTAK